MVKSISYIFLYLSMVISCASANDKTAAIHSYSKIIDYLKPSLNLVQEQEIVMDARSVNSGIEIGDGWGSYPDSKTRNNCLQDFASGDDGYQIVNIKYSEIEESSDLKVDSYTKEKLSVKATFSGGGGSASSEIEKTMVEKNVSTKKNYMADVIVQNGVSFIKGDSNKNIIIKPEYVTLYKNDRSRFLKTCGFGFVSSINKGGNLKSILTISDIKRDSLKTLNTTLSGEANYGTLLSGSAEAITKTTNNLKENKMSFSLSYIQYGGAKLASPTSLIEVKSAINSFSSSVAEKAMPISFTITPYSHLLKNNTEIVDNASTAINNVLSIYSTRLNYAYQQYLDVRKDKYKDYGNNQNFETYFLQGRNHSNAPGPIFREENYDALGDEILKEIQKISQLYKEYYYILSLSNSGSYECLTFSTLIENKVKINNSIEETCNNFIAAFNKINFNDYRFLIKLPIPKFNITNDISVLMSGVPMAPRVAARSIINIQREIYLRLIFFHWVERLSLSRCLKYQECLDVNSRNELIKNIRDTFPSDDIISIEETINSILRNLPFP